MPDTRGRTFATPDGGERTFDPPTDPDALPAYFAAVSEAAASAVELAPWLRFTCADRRMAVRIPMDARRSFVEVAELDIERWTNHQHSDLVTAWVAYNRWITARHAEGWRHRPPRWEELPSPPAPWREHQSAERRWYGHADAPDREYGPEQHLHPDGSVRFDIFQVDGVGQGWRMYTPEGVLAQLSVGDWLLAVDPSGAVTERQLRRDNVLLERWRMGDDDISVQRYTDGALVDVRFFRHDGTLEQEQRCRGDGTREVVLFDGAGRPTVRMERDVEGGLHGRAPLDPWAHDVAAAQTRLDGTPSRDAWLALCVQIERMAAEDRARLVSEVLPILIPRAQRWPVRLRLAPWLWINKLIDGALPVEVLGLASALAISPALGTTAAHNPRVPRLLAWLDALPDNVPALDGLTLSWTEAVELAVHAANAREPDARFHAEIPEERVYAWEAGVLERVLGSPLARALRVFDASLPDPLWDWTESHQGATDGDTATPKRVSDALRAPERLEVLGLRGNQPTTEEMKALPALRTLDVSRSATLGDSALYRLAQALPALERLHLTPDCRGWLIEPDKQSLAETYAANLTRYWWSPRPVRITPDGVRALLAGCPSLRRLELQSVYADDPELVAALAGRHELAVAYTRAHATDPSWTLAEEYEH